jgi:hypothetical protein
MALQRPYSAGSPRHTHGDSALEVSFGEEIQSLQLGAGQTFHGEGILAITKGLLQSGVSYVIRARRSRTCWT